MSIKAKLQERLEGHIADTLLLLGLGAIAALTWWAEYLLPDALIRRLGMLLSAQILIALSLVTILLASWVIYLRTRKQEVIAREPGKPNRIWRTDIGVWEDKDAHLFYCGKCGDHPLQNHEAGWYCVKCHWLFESLEWKAKVKREREEEDRRVREWNENSRI